MLRLKTRAEARTHIWGLKWHPWPSERRASGDWSALTEQGFPDLVAQYEK